MHSPSLLLLLGAAAAVAILHSIMPDHWVPLAVVARTQRWSLLHVGRISLLASLGHVITSLVLGGIIAIIGLQFQQEFETQQGHIIGTVLILTGIIFLIWGLLGHNSHDHAHHHHHETDHIHPHDHYTHDHHTHDHLHVHDDHNEQASSLAKRLAAIAVPFGVAASPDLTILPVALAASAVGTGAVVGVLSIFAAVTILTFLGLTVIATIAGYQIKGEWLEHNATTITSLVLIILGIVAFVGI
jgi:ABC-type nickel/cobalt efflux system permease component RcnA